MICAGCSSALPGGALSCPQCHRLAYAPKLESLAARALTAQRTGDFTAERALWQESLDLLPEETLQYRSIRARLAELDQRAAAAPHSETSSWRKAFSMGIGPTLVLLLTKGKFLLLGLTKMGTLLTMFASFGVYWTLYGWPFAAGLVLSIYIHEMGHVAMIRRYGFPASAPMFIPGLGALIFLRGAKLAPVPDARVGLAGPIYGTGAAVAACAVFLATHARIWIAIAHIGATINLFNMIPVWQLDGGRGMSSLTRNQRGIVLGAALGLWMITSTPMLLLVAMGCAYRMFTKDWQEEPDRVGLLQFLGLLAALAAIATFSAPVTPDPIG